MSEVDLNMEAVVELAEGMTIDGVAQTECPCLKSSQTQTSDGVPIEMLRISIDHFIHDPEGVKLYTGIEDFSTFMDVLASLGPAAYHLNYLYGNPSIDVKDQLFLALMKCRMYKTNVELSRMFRISDTEVYSIFITWIRFMSLQWKEVDIWPERETVRTFSPSDFQAKFPETRAVFVGFEFPVKKAKAPAAQQVTFSTYKNRNTAKMIVGVTPGGMCSYLSDAYGGATSDRQIIERSDLMTKVDPGDSLMADKGFDVQDIFAPFDVTVNIPTFFKKINRMSGKTVLRDRKIASKRVHVERMIGSAKTYTILCNPLNHTESLMASDIGFVCFMLVNFRRCIVPKDA